MNAMAFAHHLDQGNHSLPRFFSRALVLVVTFVPMLMLTRHAAIPWPIRLATWTMHTRPVLWMSVKTYDTESPVNVEGHGCLSV